MIIFGALDLGNKPHTSLLVHEPHEKAAPAPRLLSSQAVPLTSKGVSGVTFFPRAVSQTGWLAREGRSPRPGR
jgi:hypothetical protein